MSRELTTQSLNAELRGALMPRTFTEVSTFANTVGRTQFVPQAYRNKPEEIIAAVMYGSDLGLTPMQSLQVIAVVNGKPTIYGDGLLAVCQSHPAWGGKKEWVEGEGDRMTAHCVVSRKGEPDAHVTFSVADAKKAGLWGKSGPWAQYPARMMAMRARGFALRDQFADALRGIITTEEARDYPAGPDHARDVNPRPARIVDPAETIEVCDQHGQVEYLDPLAVHAWAAERATECTEDELDELFALNAGNAAIRDAVAAERKARGERAKVEFADQPPADTADITPDPQEARRLFAVAKQALADGDHAAAVKARLEAAPHLTEAQAAKFDALLNQQAVAA